MVGNAAGVIDPQKKFRCRVEFHGVGMVQESVQCGNISRRRRCSIKSSFKCTSLCCAHFSGAKVLVFAHENCF